MNIIFLFKWLQETFQIRQLLSLKWSVYCEHISYLGQFDTNNIVLFWCQKVWNPIWTHHFLNLKKCAVIVSQTPTMIDNKMIF